MRKAVDWAFTGATSILLVFSIIFLNSVAPELFPQYLIYFAVAIIAFLIFYTLGLDIFSVFNKHLYIFSLLLLLLPLIIGQVTRGTVRWIPIGALTIQPSEIVRPFILLFFANYFAKDENTTLTSAIKGLLIYLPVAALILIQPSLGVTIVTSLGVLGIIIASNFDKKYILVALLLSIIVSPIVYNYLAPYQKQRINIFLQPSQDPLGAGYNSIQSQIAVGSGKILGRGLKKGIQTQLSFLPEKHSDFVFASISEELGLVGAGLILAIITVLYYRITVFIQQSKDAVSRLFISGAFLSLFSQTTIHIGMNLGLLPITGIPLPLVSAGGSSLISTMAIFGLILSTIPHKDSIYTNQ